MRYAIKYYSSFLLILFLTACAANTKQVSITEAESMVKYASSVRTAIIKMVIGGVEIEDLDFTSRYSFTKPKNLKNAVFYPEGGNVKHVMQGPYGAVWNFNTEFEVAEIGTSKAGSKDGNDIVAFSSNLNQKLCSEINAYLGYTATEKSSKNLRPFYNKNIENNYKWPNKENILGGSDMPSLKGKPFGCFENSDGTFVYYHVMIEN